METPIKENFKMEKLMVKGFIHGKMVKSMMVNGLKGLNKAMEYGKEYQENPI